MKKIVFTQLLCIFTSFALATTYYVKTDGSNTADGQSWGTAFQTMKQATDTAVANDEVWVAQGVYTIAETVQINQAISFYGGFSGSESNLSERNIQGFETIIDGSNMIRCVYNRGTIDGIKILYGKADKGGGIYNNQTEATVRNCSVAECSAESYGGGIYNSFGTIESSRIYHNSVTDSQHDMRGGGGIYNVEGFISNCLVFQNQSFSNGGIMNNVGTVVNCTVYDNNASNHGGILNAGTEGTVSNCIMWKNTGGDYLENGGSCDHSCFRNADGSNGNIEANPLFIDTSSNYLYWNFQLQNGSPCIDSGSITSAPLTDIEGTSRPGSDQLVCMGAYESPDAYTASPPEAPVRLYMALDGDNSDGSTWHKAFTNLDDLNYYITQSNALHDIWVKAGTYTSSTVYPFFIYSNRSIYGGFNGTEETFSQRNIENNPVIFDMENKEMYVMHNSGLIDGISIINGNTSYNSFGGGLINAGIANKCRIYDNHGSGEGGGVLNLGILRNSLIYNNTSGGEGAGILNNDTATMQHCVVYDNHVNGHAYGAGLFSYGDVENTIIWGNTHEGGSDIGVTNDVYIYWGDVFNCCYPEGASQATCIYADPKFVNVAGDPDTWDFNLQSDSPCIDTGFTNTAVVDDYLGVIRPQGTGVDIGAYEYYEYVSSIENNYWNLY